MKAKNHTRGVISLFIKILFSLSNDDLRQDQEGNQIWQSHQGVNNICDNPNHIQLDKSSQQDHEHKDHTVKPDKANPKEELETTFPVIVPT